MMRTKTNTFLLNVMLSQIFIYLFKKIALHSTSIKSPSRPHPPNVCSARRHACHHKLLLTKESGPVGWRKRWTYLFIYLLLSFEVKYALPKACSERFPFVPSRKKEWAGSRLADPPGHALGFQGSELVPHWFGWQNCHCPGAWVGDGSSYF